MKSWQLIVAGLRAAFMLAGGRPEGVLLLPNERRAAVFSFWSLGLCALPFAVLRWLDWRTAWPDHPRHDAILDLLGYITGWLAFALLSHRLARVLGRDAIWLRYIAVWNWCNLPQYLLLLASALPGVLGAPDWVGEAAAIVALFWSLWLEWFATRLALGLPRLPAAAFVATDVLIGLFLTGLINVPG